MSGATSRSYGMFPQFGFLVDSETIMSANGDTVNVDKEARAGLGIGGYFTPDAAGYAVVNGTYRTIASEEDQTTGLTTEVKEIARLYPPAHGGKVVSISGGYQEYELVSVALDTSNMTAGSIQISLF